MMHDLRIDNAALTAIRRQAERAWPAECCGLLMGKRDASVITVQRARPSANMSEADVSRHYVIDPAVLVQALLGRRPSGERLIGFYHSHPDGTAVPSRRDRAHAWTDMAYLIVGVSHGRAQGLAAWEVTQGGGWVERCRLDTRAPQRVTFSDTGSRTVRTRELDHGQAI